MRVSVYAVLALTAVIALLAPRLSAALAPAHAARAMALLAVTASAADGGALVIVAAGGLGRIAEVISRTGASYAAVYAVDPVPRLLGALAALLLAWRAARLARAAGTWRRHRARHRNLAAGPEPGCELVVIPGPECAAFAVPGTRRHPGRIVVSQPMLRALTAAERRVLFAHERAHLDHAHHRWRAAAAWAAAFNPLLSRLEAEVTYATERWADEEAAAEAGDRPLAARSLIRAALAAAGAPHPHAAYARDGVPGRVGALLAPPPRSRWHRALPAAAVTVLTVALSADAAFAFARFIEYLRP